MTPIAVLTKLLAVDENTAKFIFGGIALFAAAAIVLGFHIDLNTAVRVVVLILVGGFVVRALVAIPVGGLLYTVAGWILMIFFFLVLAAAVFGALFNPTTGLLVLDTSRNGAQTSWLQGIECLVRPLQSCVTVQDAVTAPANNPVPVAPVQENADTAAVEKGKYTIYIQFAGYQRGTIMDVARSLEGAGWIVAGRSQGGERLASAAGLSKVVYGQDSAKAAAEQLARDINQTGVKSDVKAVLDPIIPEATLEVWIGQ